MRARVSWRLVCASLFAIALHAAPRASRAQGPANLVRGTVVDSDGTTLPEVAVGIASLHRATRTDSYGHFSLGRLPDGDFEVSVRRIGYAPRTIAIKVGAKPLDAMSIVLAAQPEVLTGVSATERQRRQMIEDFYWRKMHGTGTYFTREDIVARGASYPTDVVRGTPGINVIHGRYGTVGIRFNTTSSMHACIPQLWLDGQHAAGMELDDIPVNDIEGIELYATSATTPAQFWQGNQTSCGTIVIWTRNPGGP